MRWKVTGSSGVTAAGGGTLRSGRFTYVTATKPDECDPPGPGTVSFSPGGTASIDYDCDVFGH